LDHVTSSELPHELVAYRGMHNIDPSTLKKGDTFTDRGFASHPLDPMVAARFTDKIRTPYFGAEKRHVFRVHFPEGIQGHYIDHEHSDYGEGVLAQA
jgi:hypothetical protein